MGFLWQLKKNSRIDQRDNWSQKKHRNNQSDGVMLDER